MVNKPTNKDIVLGYVSQVFNIGSGILIIPLAAKYLSPEEMGLWYLFLSLSSLAQLLEFGLQPTVIRFISYIYSGANDIKLGEIASRSNGISPSLLNEITVSIRKLYGYISIIAFFMLTVLGGIYLNVFSSFQEEQFIAWFIYALSVVMNLYFSYISGIISGRGEQSKVYVTITVSKILMLLMMIPFLYLGYGLMSMAIASFISSLVSRILLYIYYNRDIVVKKSKKINTELKDYRVLIFKSAKNLGLISLGSFLITKANMFVASSFLGLDSVASYGLSSQVISIISSVSGMFFYINMPALNSLQMTKDSSKIKSLFLKSILVVYFLFIFGSLVLVIFGGEFLGFIEAKTNLLNTYTLILMLLVSLLDLNHSICATYLTSRNTPPSPIPIILSGIAILILSVILINLLSIGVMALVVSQFFVQLVFNNWYWPYKAIKTFSYG